ncbi:MAG: GIY-YIG nuclease family protein [Bacteroidota bacterium]
MFGGMFYTYILRSLRDGTYYYGHCADLHARLAAHNAGRGHYTKGHSPYVLHYWEAFNTKREATARERFFKSLAGNLWLRAKGIINPERCRSG